MSSLPRAGASSRTSSPSQTSGIMSCSELLRRDWKPPGDQTPDFSWDPESGEMDVYFTSDHLKINALSDRACQKLPLIGPLIGRMVAAAASTRVSRP